MAFSVRPLRVAARPALALICVASRGSRKRPHFAERELGAKWRKTKENLPGNGNAVHLTRPWAIYSVKVDGRTVVDAYLESRRRRSSQEELAWLEAQRAAWLSVWEVEDVNPGETVALHDLLSGERGMVREILASRSLNLRDAVLARVLDHDGLSLLAGVHAIPLPPFEAADVVDHARARLRRKGAVPVERLRDPAFGLSLMRYWEEAVEEVRLRSAQPLNCATGTATSCWSRWIGSMWCGAQGKK